MPSTFQWASMPQKVFEKFYHAAHCGRRPRVFCDKQFCVGITAFLVFKNFQPKGQATGGRTPFYFIWSSGPFPVVIWFFQPQHKVLFKFSKVFNISRALQPYFSVVRQFFNKVQGQQPLSHFNFKPFSKVPSLPTIKYFTRFDRKGEGHARVSHPLF